MPPSIKRPKQSKYTNPSKPRLPNHLDAHARAFFPLRPNLPPLTPPFTRLMGKIGGAPLDRGSPTDKARWVHQEIQRAGWWECRLPGRPDGWASVPRATLGTGTGSGPWRERHGQSIATQNK